jgi:hypothetical protein
MLLSHRLRAPLFGLIAILGASISPAANADSGTVRVSIFKAGWVVGGSAGRGTLTFHGKQYPLRIGGLSAGIVFGASQTRLSGTVTNIHKPSDIEGVYGGAGAGATLVGGVRVITMTNGKGAHLRLQGGQVGLMVNADLSGMSVSLR